MVRQLWPGAAPLGVVQPISVINLMAYALGRRVEYYDKPALRAIVKNAKADDYRMSSFILGVVKSDAFQMQSVQVVVDEVEYRDRP